MKRLAILACLVALGGCANNQAPTEVLARERLAGSPAPDVSAVQRGAAYAEANCASCHSIGRAGESRLAGAPPFRTLGLRYPIEDLAEAFAEGIVTAHPAMPQFVMSSEENADLIAYLQSIQSPASR